MDFPDFDLSQALYNLLQLIIAFVLALPVALNREHGATLGLRTIPLVAMVSTGYILIGYRISDGDPGAQARALQGLITGVGFLGGGAIVKRGTSVHGTATAASIWATAALGAAVAFGRYEIALALSVATFFTLHLLTSLKDKINNTDPRDPDHPDHPDHPDQVD